MKPVHRVMLVLIVDWCWKISGTKSSMASLLRERRCHTFQRPHSCGLGYRLYLEMQTTFFLQIAIIIFSHLFIVVQFLFMEFEGDYYKDFLCTLYSIFP